MRFVILTNKGDPVRIVSFIVVAVSMLTLPLVGQETNLSDTQTNGWPQWRGPLATGVSPTANPPMEWSETQNVRWKVELSGHGSASPIVWDDHIFILSAIPAGPGNSDGPGLFGRLRNRLLGAVGGPKWESLPFDVQPERGLLGIRKELGLFANLRPVKVYPALINSSPLKPEFLEGVDMMVLRELTGGLYFGKPKKRWNTSRGRRGVDTLKYTESEIERILRVGFELAMERRKKLTSVDKQNVLESSRLWREIAIEVGKDYPEVELIHMLADNAAMKIITNPKDCLLYTSPSPRD